MSERDRFGKDDPDAPWEALARSLSGEDTPAEREALQRELAASPERSALVEALDRAVRRTVAPPQVDVEGALGKVRARRQAASAARVRSRTTLVARRWPVPVLRWAAALVVALGAGLLWRALTPAAAEYATAAGEWETVRLPDGSSVRLGPGSRLSRAPGYGRRRRTLALEGEGYFVVRHGGPDFVVRTPAAEIRDLGTAFTVRAAAGRARVVVTEGSVAVRSRAGGSPALLRAGDVVVVEDGRPTLLRGAGSPDDLAWTRGRLVFRDVPLSHAVDELERWYGVRIRVAEPALARRRITAALEGRSPQEALTVIAATLGAGLQRRGDTLVVVSGEQR